NQLEAITRQRKPQVETEGQHSRPPPPRDVFHLVHPLPPTFDENLLCEALRSGCLFRNQQQACDEWVRLCGCPEGCFVNTSGCANPLSTANRCCHQGDQCCSVGDSVTCWPSHRPCP